MKGQFRSSFDTSMSAMDFKSLFERSFIYGWMRDGDFLYIGSTCKGFKRLISHDIVGVVEPILDKDYFCFWFCLEVDRFEYEARLIREIKPKYQSQDERSKRLADVKRLKRICRVCGDYYVNKNPAMVHCFTCRSRFIKCDVKLALSCKTPHIKLVPLPRQ